MEPLEFTIADSVPNIEQTLQLSILFLQKFEGLTKAERKTFNLLLHKLTNPLIQITKEIENES